MVQPLHIRGAKVWDGNKAVVRDLFTDGERIAAERHPKAVTVDLDGYTIFPGLINAHDHLELNHYPRSKFREKYDNAHQWGEDMNARLNDEPYKSLRAYPLEDRCFIGGLKNLLCGATTVAHHNPPHKCLFRKDFPVRVLKNYGWAHSLHFNTDEEIVQSYRSTPKDWPWFIHLAEGTDAVAAGEMRRFYDLIFRESEFSYNVILVHCVGIGLYDEQDIHEISCQSGGIVWCPSTNYFLLNQTTDLFIWAIWTNLLMGSDSRLTADGDLLDELRKASKDTQQRGFGKFPESARWLIKMITSNSAEEFRLTDVGHVSEHALADFVVVRMHDNDAVALCTSRRADLALVVKGGVPQIGDPEVMAKFAGVKTVAAVLDGKPKAIHVDLAKRIHACSLKEAGLEVEAVAKGRKFSFFNHRDTKKYRDKP